MTAPLAKHHDADKVDEWFEKSFGMTIVKWTELSNRRPVSRALREVELIFDRRNIQGLIDGFKREVLKSNAGQKSKVSEAAALMLLFVSIRAGNKMSLMGAVKMLMNMSRKQRRRLGFRYFSEDHQDLMYDRVWAALARLRQLLDDEPGNRNEATPAPKYLKDVADRDLIEMARRRRRRHILMNELLQGSVDLLADEVRDRHAGVVAIDATFLSLAGRQKLAENMGASDSACTNHGGGWYVREGDHKATSATLKTAQYGIEIELAIWARNSPDADMDFPLLFSAIGDHKPGELKGAGRQLLDVMLANGMKVTTLVADRAYTPNAMPEDLQLPFIQHGVNLVMDYGIKQLGIQAYWTDGRHSLVMCDGSWYPDTMPMHLQLCEETYAKAKVTAENLKKNKKLVPAAKMKADAHELVVKQRDERGKFRLTPRSRHAADGSRQYSYPELSEADRYYVNERGEVVEYKFPGKTVKVPGVIGTTPEGEDIRTHLKYGQEYEFKSEKWRRIYGLRNTIESGNASLKNEEELALGNKMQRLVRGPWFAALCAAMAAACENIDRIVDWYQERLGLPHRNQKNRSHPSVYKIRNSEEYRASRRRAYNSVEPPDEDIAA